MLMAKAGSIPMPCTSVSFDLVVAALVTLVVSLLELLVELIVSLLELVVSPPPFLHRLKYFPSFFS